MTLPTPGQEDRCAKGMHADQVYVLSHMNDAAALHVLWCGACARVALARFKPGTVTSERQEVVLHEGATSDRERRLPL